MNGLPSRQRVHGHALLAKRVGCCHVDGPTPDDGHDQQGLLVNNYLQDFIYLFTGIFHFACADRLFRKFHTDVRFTTPSMRSLPWLTDGSEPSGTVKRKRPTSSSKKSSLESGQVKREEPSESSSDSDDTTILDNSADNAYDAMIQGYGHDDAYIMVEHDLIEAAKQITRHIHLEAYQKQVTAPITGEIMRPTSGKPKPKLVVEGENEEDEEVGEKDVSTLGELLRRRPTATLVPATPIRKKEVRSVETVDVKTIDLTLDGSQHKKDVSIRNEITRRVIIKENRNMSQDATYDDDEDLDKPPAKVTSFDISSLTVRY